MDGVVESLISAALAAVNPYAAIVRYLRREGDELTIADRCYNLADWDVCCVAVGKAAVPMALAVAEILGEDLWRGLVVTKYAHLREARFSRCWETIESGHPIPDDLSLHAGDRVESLLGNCTERTLILACISGGASAVVIAPQNGDKLQQLLLTPATQPLIRHALNLNTIDPQSSIPLATLQQINSALLDSGLTIAQMNAVRSKLDRLKAGGLVAQAAPGQVLGLILSDVVGDSIATIGSGLTNHPQATNILVGNNRQACEAAAITARSLGYDPHIVTTELTGEASLQGREIAIEIATRSPKTILIYGGETTVTLSAPHGRGGRNQELALAAAIELDLHHTPAIVVTLATDGTDGPTDAAGATVNELTIDRARALGLDAGAYLQRHDSYSFFQQLGDLRQIGATGTNVADITIAIRR